jgi:hypothetical protein
MPSQGNEIQDLLLTQAIADANKIRIPETVLQSAEITADAHGEAFIFKASESGNVAKSDDWFVRRTSNFAFHRPVVLAAHLCDGLGIILSLGFKR